MADAPIPTQTPGQAPNAAAQPASDIPELPPGTFEYVDSNKKRNWMRIIEICAVIIIVAIPLVLTLFKKDYSFERTYAVLNPASFVTSPSYSPWSSFVTTAKKIIQPEAPTTNQAKKELNVPTTTPTSTPTVTPMPTVSPTKAIDPTLSEKQIEVITESAEELTPSPTSPNIFYPTEPSPYEQDGGEEPTVTPTPPNSPYAACKGKQKGDKCVYISNGKQVEGKCKQSNGIYLICVKQ